MAQANPMNTGNEDAIYETKNLDHLGLVAAQFDALGLVELIDGVIEKESEKRTVSVGQAVKAMVINGLGFANHTLYLMPKFYANKPVERLIGKGVSAQDLNQNLFGRCLDLIHDFDVTNLFSILSSHTVKQLELPCSAAHIDTTSFHVDGKYNSGEDEREGELEGIVQITKGYSRDHRPDLNQIGLQLIVENQAGIPLVMQALSGNCSDKTSFSDAIETHVRQLQVDLTIEYLVGDSALYTAESLQKMKDIFWISRVPETRKDAQHLIEQIAPDLMTNRDKEACRSVCVSYAGIAQRWIVNDSPPAIAVH